MKIAEVLLERKNGFSCEFFPPKTEKGRQNLLGTFLKLCKFNPLFVSMTYGAAGGNRKDALAAVEILARERKTEILAHLTCLALKKEEIEEHLKKWQALGIKNILALRGDPPKDISPRGDFKHAWELVKFIKEKGDFSIAVAVYPEGHPEAVSLDEDIRRTREKIASGADFAITQMFFKNEHFYRFIDRLKPGIPVIAGIMPVVNFEKIKEFASFCKAEIPDEMEKIFSKLKTEEDIKKAGIEYAARQCEDLAKHGFKLFHFYTLNKEESVVEILKKLEK